MADVSNSSDQPPLKQQKIDCPMNDLADEVLLNVCKHLPPRKRVMLSMVCKRWNEITRVPWRDVVTLDLSSVPWQKIGTVIKKCPNLQSLVFQHAANFRKDELHLLSRVALSSLKLYDCAGDAREHGGEAFDPFLALFSKRLPRARWDELVLHGLTVDVSVDACKSCYGCSVVSTLPGSLKRLQLSGDFGLAFDGPRGFWRPTGEDFLDGLSRLRNLTCLILCSAHPCCLLEAGVTSFVTELAALANLVELCIRTDGDFYEGFLRELVDCCFELPKLEVVFLSNVMLQDSETLKSVENLTCLATTHPTLRILALTESVHLDEEKAIPARHRNPPGVCAESDPLPLLHVFLGKQAADKLRFEESPPEALKIHLISEPLPKFLEKPEIAPIFEGVWIAAQIKEGAKHGATLWKYAEDVVELSGADDE